jgi:hypothetical protein
MLGLQQFTGAAGQGRKDEAGIARVLQMLLDQLVIQVEFMPVCALKM